MGPEFWVTLGAVFIAGGAIGSTGTLLAQWLLRKVDGGPGPRRGLEAPDLHLLRGEVADMGRHIRNFDARLDFTEQLLGGALPLAPPPDRLPPTEPVPEEDEPDEAGDGD
jgi:hypothetical protein